MQQNKHEVLSILTVKIPKLNCCILIWVAYSGRGCAFRPSFFFPRAARLRLSRPYRAKPKNYFRACLDRAHSFAAFVSRWSLQNPPNLGENEDSHPSMGHVFAARFVARFSFGILTATSSVATSLGASRLSVWSNEESIIRIASGSCLATSFDTARLISSSIDIAPHIAIASAWQRRATCWLLLLEQLLNACARNAEHRARVANAHLRGELARELATKRGGPRLLGLGDRPRVLDRA